MPRSPTELDLIEHHLQAAARAIRESQQGDLEVERMRNEIYKHVYEGIEICARYAYASHPARTTTGPPTRAPHVPPSLAPPAGGGVGRGATKSVTMKDIKFAAKLASDLDLLK